MCTHREEVGKKGGGDFVCARADVATNDTNPKVAVARHGSPGLASFDTMRTAVVLILTSTAVPQASRPVGAAALRIDCATAVSPVDPSPIRSPQVVHSVMANEFFAGKSVVEIGTRNGDGIACFARVASSTTAIEMDTRYCAKLEARARSETPFRVLCAEFGTSPQKLSSCAARTHAKQRPPPPPTMRTSALFVMLLGSLATTHAISAEVVFNYVDKDNDDKLSFDELKSTVAKDGTQESFDESDTDDDGFLSLDEFKVQFEKTMAKKKEGAASLERESAPPSSSARDGPYILGAAIILAAAIVYDKKRPADAATPVPTAGVHEMA